MKDSDILPGAGNPGTHTGWSRSTRLAVSALLLLHVTAIIAAPCSVEPASILSLNIFRIFRPYLDAAYLNHGYHFFAPEPGPSHLVRYEVELPDGSRKAGHFPNRDEHWPRLLYHRHFMLSEHLNVLADPEGNPELLAACSESFGRHLLKQHSARRVSLFLMRHLLAKPEDVLKGMKLTDGSLYRERPLGTFGAGDP